MKNLTKILALSFSFLLFFSCNNDDVEGKLTTEQKVTLLNSYNWVVDLTYVSPSNISSKNIGQNACESLDYLTFNTTVGEEGLIIGDYTMYEYTEQQGGGCTLNEPSNSYCFTYNPTTTIFSNNNCLNEALPSSIKSNNEDSEEIKLIIANDHIILDNEKFIKTEKPMKK